MGQFFRQHLSLHWTNTFDWRPGAEKFHWPAQSIGFIVDDIHSLLPNSLRTSLCCRNFKVGSCSIFLRFLLDSFLPMQWTGWLWTDRQWKDYFVPVMDGRLPWNVKTTIIWILRTTITLRPHSKVPTQSDGPILWVKGRRHQAQNLS